MMTSRLRQLLAIPVLLSAAAAVAEAPIMGWSSWNTYRVNISDEIICRQADAMKVNGMSQAGYSFINIDDGFFGGRDSDGQLLFHPVRFPNGLKPVVDHIHSLGLKAGIYSDAGRNTCGNFWDSDSAGINVGLYGHDSIDAELYFKHLGFDFIKIDFCGGDAKQNTDHLDLDERERYTAVRHAIDATGRNDVRINVCRWAFPGTWVQDIALSWRVSPDIAPDWNSIKRIIAINRNLSAYASPGHYKDMDMLEIGRGLTEAEERTHFGMWCIMSSPLLIGCDLTSIRNSSLALITNPEVIALNQDTLGLQAYCVSERNGVQLYVKDLLQLNGTIRAVALYNPTDSAVTYTLDPAEVCLSGNVKAHDLFARTDIGSYPPGSAITLFIPAHDTALLRLEGEQRSERTTYEAEHAWLKQYHDLGINPALGHATYASHPLCSGGWMVTYLGHHPDNYMEFRDVWSREGGTYKLTVDYLPQESASFQLSVNGSQPETINTGANIGNDAVLATATATVHLRKGLNTIRISNPSRWTPAIDCIRLTHM